MLACLGCKKYQETFSDRAGCYFQSIYFPVFKLNMIGIHVHKFLNAHY